MRVLFCTDGSKISYHAIQNFYNWMNEYDCYYFGNEEDDYLTCVDDLQINIMCVKGNDYEEVVVPMTKVDADGKYWSAEIDVAYMNAQMDVSNEEVGMSTWGTVLPKKEGTMLDGNNEWTIYGMDEVIDEIADEIGAYDEATVTEDDVEELQAIIAKVEELLAEDKYLSDEQENSLNAIKTKAQGLLDVIEANANNGGNSGNGDGGNDNDGNNNDGNNDDGNNNDGNNDGGNNNGGAIEDTPATGDYSYVMMWMVVMAVCASTLAVAKKYKITEG